MPNPNGRPWTSEEVKKFRWKQVGENAPYYKDGITLLIKDELGYRTGNILSTGMKEKQVEMTRKTLEEMDLSREQVVNLDYDGKIALLDAVGAELLDMRIEFGEVAARYTELRSQLQVLKEVKSLLQSSIRAEQYG